MRLPALNRPLFLVCCVSLAALTACDDSGVRITSTSRDTDAKGILKVVDALQCPDSMGSLTRKGSAQADGTVCTYTGPRGAEVSLHLVKLGDDPVETVLGRFETLLTAAMPLAAANIAAAAADDARRQAEADRGDADAARTDAQAAQVQANAASGSSESAHVSGPGVDIQAKDDRARVNLPGIHVEADGDRANVRIGGFTIQANDTESDTNGASGPGNRSSNVRINGDLDAGEGQSSVSIQANDDGAEIRTRAPGEATRQTWLLTGSAPSDTGWRMVGYEARGPRDGPIVVATIRARERHADRIFDDAKDLVTLNVGE